MTAVAGLDADLAFTSMEQRMMKLSMAFATGALLIAAAAPSFAGNTTAAGSSPAHNAEGTDSARSGAPHRNGTTGVSTPSDSGSAGTITNGQAAQMPTSPSATRQDTDTDRPSGTDRKAGKSSDRSRSGSSDSETGPAR